MEKSIRRAQCSNCGFEFDDGIYLMKNKKDWICIFCLKNKYNISVTDLIDQRQIRILGDILDREGCVHLFADLL